MFAKKTSEIVNKDIDFVKEHSLYFLVVKSKEYNLTIKQRISFNLSKDQIKLGYMFFDLECKHFTCEKYTDYLLITSDIEDEFKMFKEILGAFVENMKKYGYPNVIWN